SHRSAESVVNVQEYRRFRRVAADFKQFLLDGKSIAKNHRRGRKIPEYELLAFIGEWRSSGDIDDEWDAFLLGNLGDCRALARVECADEQLRAVADQLFRPRARDLDLGLGVGIDDVQRRHPEFLQDAVGDIDAALAILADPGLNARAGQQHADLQSSALRANDVERCGSSHDARG